MLHVAECFVHDESGTVYRFVKHIPPCHEQDMKLPTRGFRETVNRLTVQLVQTQAPLHYYLVGISFPSKSDVLDRLCPHLADVKVMTFALQV
jgi:hypothetical protein